jgi:hypothetical protein
MVSPNPCWSKVIMCKIWLNVFALLFLCFFISTSHHCWSLVIDDHLSNLVMLFFPQWCGGRQDHGFFFCLFYLASSCSQCVCLQVAPVVVVTKTARYWKLCPGARPWQRSPHHTNIASLPISRPFRTISYAWSSNANSFAFCCLLWFHLCALFVQACTENVMFVDFSTILWAFWMTPGRYQ